MADIAYSSRAVGWIATADPAAREQVRTKTEQAAEFPERFLDPLTNGPYSKRRAGQYRCLVPGDVTTTSRTPFVRDIGHRDGFSD
jgi:hypothetical protein